LIIIHYNKEDEQFELSFGEPKMSSEEFNEIIVTFKQMYFTYNPKTYKWSFPRDRIDEIIQQFEKLKYEYIFTPYSFEIVEEVKASYKRESKFFRFKQFKNIYTPEGIVPYEFQKDAINWVLKRNACLNSMDTGTGKSFITIQVISQLFDEGAIDGLLLILPNGLSYHWAREFLMFSNKFKEDDFQFITNENKFQPFANYKDKKIIMVSGHLLHSVLLSYKKGYKFGDSAKKIRWKDGAYCNIKEEWNKANLAIVIDESHCFSYDTEVHTDIGVLTIGYIVKNRLTCRVLSFNVITLKFEYKPILTYFEHEVPNKELCNLSVNSKIITCTKNHPYFTNDFNYKSIGDFNDNENLWVLPERIHNRIQNKKILRLELRREMETCSTRDKSKIHFRENKRSKSFRIKKISRREPRKMVGYLSFIFRKDESRKPYDDSRQNGYVIERKTLAWVSWRKRNWYDCTSRVTDKRTGKRLDCGICCTYKNEAFENRIYNKLQNRYSSLKVKNSHRGRWIRAQHKKGNRNRQKENSVFGNTGLESITFQKQRDIREYAGSYGENTTVYNLHIADNNNYFANNILVHNCFKHPTSIRTKALMSIKKYFDYRYLLTATPNINRIEDCYTQFSFIDRSILPMSYNAFKLWLAKTIGNKYDRYAITSYNHEHVQELKDKYPSVMMQVLKTDLPEMKVKKTVSQLYLQMHPLQYRLYALVADAEMELLNREFDEPTWTQVLNRLPAMMKAIDCPSALKTKKYENPEIAKILHSWKDEYDPKIILLDSLLDNYIDNLNEKVVVYDNSPDILNILTERFKKYNPEVIHGSLDEKDKDKERQDKIDKFNNDPKVKVIFLSSLTSSAGINLQKSCHRLIFYSSPWSSEHFRQAQDRIHRINSTRDSIIQIMVYPNSIDQIRVNRNLARVELNDNMLNQKMTQSQLCSLLQGII